MTKKRFLQAVIDAIPLGVSVTPWGILFGSLAIQAGLSAWQGQLMSLLVFAGAAQMSGVAIMGAGGNLSSLLNSTVMISARHLLYSAAYRDDIRDLPLVKRVVFAFLLTDEMFAIAHADREKHGRFDYAYAVVSGFAFYLIWNAATLVGIVAAQSVQGIEDLGLDFAIAATFIAMTVPRLKGRVMLIAVVISGALSVILEWADVQNALMIAGLVGMAVGYILTERGVRWKP
ncbi:MAG: branched-chain amino acid ABC transporter permease [Gammaproteobacteria bacterium]|nr:MAG: branched-chain amino acid ABC transporter permease [Gammaproteobacteria bacterium]